MNIASRSRSKFSIDSIDNPLQVEATTLTVENASLKMASSSRAGFEERVQVEVAKVIASMLAAGTIDASSPSSSSPYFHVNDPQKTDFNPVEKHGTSLFSKTTEELVKKDKFTLNTDKAKKLSHVLKTKTSTYFWDTSFTKIPQEYPIIADKCKNLLICLNQSSLQSIKKDGSRCWGKKIDQLTDDDFNKYGMKYPKFGIVKLDPDKDADDKVLFYERVRCVMIVKTIKGMLEDAALATLNLNKTHWT